MLSFLRPVRFSRLVSLRSHLRTIHTLVIADHDNGKLASATLASITAASKIGGSVSLLVAGENCRPVCEQAANLVGLSKLLQADSPAYAHQLPENLSALVFHLQTQNKYTHVLTAATSVGKNFLPRLAAAFDSAAITDVIAVKAADTFTRPIYAGNALSTVKSKDACKFITIRPTNFLKAIHGTVSLSIEKTSLPAQPETNFSKWDSEEVKKSDRPELTSARVVIAGGRGMKSGEHFNMLYEMADSVKNGAVGASRAAVDSGFVANELQIGQTGKVVAPDLYVAVGISGAIQHLAGMKDSKVIVAINKDADAPIFDIADFGLVGDLFKVVPEMTAEIKAQQTK